MTLARRKTKTKAQVCYHDAIAGLGCVVCRFRKCKQPNATRIHHRNVGDLHGQRQMGQDYVVAMCDWHHQGIPAFGLQGEAMRDKYGPSFELHARDFRIWTQDVLPNYGRGTEAWQRYQDELLESEK